MTHARERELGVNRRQISYMPSLRSYPRMKYFWCKHLVLLFFRFVKRIFLHKLIIKISFNYKLQYPATIINKDDIVNIPDIIESKKTTSNKKTHLELIIFYIIKMLSSGSKRLKLSTKDHHVEKDAHIFFWKKHVLYRIWRNNYILYIPSICLSDTRTRDQI